MPRSIRNIIFAVLVLAFAEAASAGVDLTASPTTFSPGAKIKVTAEGLTGGTNYKLRLEPTLAGTKYDLATFSSGLGTTVALSPVIPNASAGDYKVVLYSGAFYTTKVTEVPAKVVGGLSITLNPTTAPPGKAVVVSVSNLVAGAVRVKYAGETILGPTAVGDGAWSAKFVVPKDRPASLPATVAVAVENLVGKTVPKTGSVNFAAQAPSGAPKLSLNLTAAPATKLDRGTSFLLGGTLKTDENTAPTGDQHLYWKGANGVVLPLDSEMTLGQDGSFALEARAPDWYRDGYVGVDDQLGDLVFVNQGKDANTDSDSDLRSAADDDKQLVVDGDAGGAATFTLILKGIQPGTDPPLANVVVEAQEEYQDSFGFATPGVGDNDDRWVMQSFSATQFTASRSSYPITNIRSYGCPLTTFRRTSNSEGKVTFSFDPESVQRTNVVQVLDDCADGNCSNKAAQGVPGGKRFGTKAASDIDLSGAIQFGMVIYAAPAGYRKTEIAIAYLPDTKQFVNVGEGTLFQNNTGTVLLEPSAQTDLRLGDVLTIDGLDAPARKYPGDCEPDEGGTCYFVPYRFGVMYTFPNTGSYAGKWGDGLFTSKNVGRKARLVIDQALYGTLTQGSLELTGLGITVPFVPSGNPPACALDDTQAIEYVATLPDLTRVPPGPLSGTVRLTLGAFVLAPQSIVIATQTPPTGIDGTNPNIKTLFIDALNDTINGEFKVASPGINVPSPGHGIGNMDNKSTNSSVFEFIRTPDAQAAQAIISDSTNQVAANDGGKRTADGGDFGWFGFVDTSHQQPEQVILFDTGLIPLFRYTWGIEPIAGATLGADFWLASELAYYGQLRSQGMNATIDPTVEGGVDIFFDLDLLFGLVSASITAETTIGLTMRTVVGNGGLPNQHSGECFKFDLDIEWEACAVGICGGDRENLIAVREPGGCAVTGARVSPLLANKLLPDATQFDLRRPRPVANALANDGRGNTISLGVTDAGALVATHLSGGIVESTKTIAASTVAVQHVDVAFYAVNKAMAVWSENTKTVAQVAKLMQDLGGGAFDDIVKTQRLRYSYFDGTAWSAPANLTSVGNDGKPQLAGCLAPLRFATSTCPLGGEITVVWERDANANLNAPDLEVWSSSWSPGDKAWATPARVSATGLSSDMLPKVAYRNGIPVVAWVTSPEGQFTALIKRRPVYRFLDGSVQHTATELGVSVGWIDLGVDDSDRVVIAYTQAQDTAGFVGNRQALKVARGTCTAGSCTFDVTEPRDPNGRQFRVERPTVMFDEDGTTIVGFRAVGFGPNAQGKVGLPGDPPGTLLGTGELATLRIPTFATATVTSQFRPLTSDGLQHWKPDMVFDDTMGGVLAVSRDAVAPIGKTAAMQFVKAFSPKGLEGSLAATGLSDGASLRTLDAGPDFTLRTPVLSKRVVGAGDTLTLSLKLVNQGQAYDPAVHGPLSVVATWNAPAGSGTVAGSYNLTLTQAANAQRSLSIPLTVPAGVSSDERQTLFIDIVAGEDANAIGGTADQLREVLNIMPVPTNVGIATRFNSNFVNVTWDATTDARVYGWRVWRLADDGTWKHLGATTSPGYIDILAPIGQEVQYRVASYSANGMESEPSAAASGFIEAAKPDVLFGNGFEGP